MMELGSQHNKNFFQPTMTFALVNLYPPRNQIAITKDEFEHARRSRGMLSLAMDVEEKFNILLENYVEYEKDLLNEILQWSLY